jgi:hypothetical protein
VQAGRACNRAVVVYGPYVSQSEEVCIDVRGITAFNVEVLPNKNPVQVGESPSFIVKVLNPGQNPLRIQNFECTIPANMQYEAGVAPDGQPLLTGAGARVAGYRPTITIPPGRSVIYEVRAKATAPGNARFKIGLVAPELGSAAAYTQEQSITIYDPDDARALPETTQRHDNQSGPTLSAPVRFAGGQTTNRRFESEKPKPAAIPRLPISLAPASATTSD